MSNGKAPIKFIAGRATRNLAEKIVERFGTTLTKVNILNFSDGEFLPSIDETVRGCNVFIVQSTFPPSDNLMELLLLADAAKRASAYKVIAVIPYYGWARQDRKDKPRVPISAKLVADLIAASGIDRVVTMDLHADQIQGFFNIPVDHIYSSAIFVPYIKSLNLDNLCIAAPDVGASKKASAYSRYLLCDLAICYKLRKQPNEANHIGMIGDVKNKNVIILDDIIDTAGTITLAAEVMYYQGAKSIRVIATHGLFSGNAINKIENSPISEIVVTDSIPLKKSSPKIKVLSVADLFAEVINKIYNLQSISSSFIVM